MIDTYSVPLKTLVDEFKLDIAFRSTDYESIRITVEDVARPGLQLAGFFDHYEPMRLQVMGNVEMSYVAKLESSGRSAIYDRLFSYKFPAMIIARDITPHPEMLAMARKHNITILRSPNPTSAVVSSIITYLKGALAPRVTRHGVLVEVYGEGILLTGDSGIGKSEAAIELLKRGHRLPMSGLWKYSGTGRLPSSPAFFIIWTMTDWMRMNVTCIVREWLLSAVWHLPTA